MILTQDDLNLCLGSVELLPCPFCGAKAMSHGERTENGKAIRWKIQCTGSKGLWPNCHASVIGVDPDQATARAQAVERWNKRIEASGELLLAGQVVLASATPNKRDHPSMAAAWKMMGAAVAKALGQNTEVSSAG